MSGEPLCPNCGRRMVLTRSLEPARGDADVHVFKCKICDVGFITEDHLPIAGVLVRGD